jgi:Rab GDP dissociation inhibitor
VYKKFCPDQAVPDGYRDRDFNVDLVPKFMMANGEIVRFLTHTGVTRYLEFKQINGSYVYKDGSIYRVPASEAEAISSSLLGLMEKRRVQKFFEFIQNWQEIDPSSHQGTTRLRQNGSWFKLYIHTYFPQVLTSIRIQ